MTKFLNNLLNFIQSIFKSKEVKEALTELQKNALIDLQAIAYQAIAEAKAGNFTTGEERRVAAFNRVWTYAMNQGKTYPKSIINWLIEHLYQRFV